MATEQRYAAPVAEPGTFGAWEISLFDDKTGTTKVIVVVAESLVPIVNHYGRAVIEAKFIAEGTCLIDSPQTTREVIEE